MRRQCGKARFGCTEYRDALATCAVARRTPNDPAGLLRIADIGMIGRRAPLDAGRKTMVLRGKGRDGEPARAAGVFVGAHVDYSVGQAFGVLKPDVRMSWFSSSGARE